MKVNLTSLWNTFAAIHHSDRNVIIWFNPPFSKNVKTNIGKMFFKLIHKHFPKSRRFSIMFSTNRMELSYSATSNIEILIKQHNKSVLHKRESSKTRLCNCRNKGDCQFNVKYLEACIVYKADVSTWGKRATYYGTAVSDLKSIYNNHIERIVNVLCTFMHCRNSC